MIFVGANNKYPKTNCFDNIKDSKKEDKVIPIQASWIPEIYRFKFLIPMNKLIISFWLLLIKLLQYLSKI